MGISQDEFLALIQYIPSIFDVLNEAYKLYLYWTDFPKSNVDKFLNFLTFINLVKPDIVKGQSAELNEAPTSSIQLTKQTSSKASREQHRMQRTAVYTMI